MAITTVETVNIEYNGVTVDTYGLSDTLDNYTIDDIKNYVYCSCTNKTIRGFQEFVDRAEITLFNDSFPFFTTKLATNGRFLFDVNAGSTLPIPDGAYVFTVWLKCSNTLEMTSSNLSDAKMVTAMNAPRMKYTLPNPKGTKDNVTTWSGGDGSQCYQTGDDKGSLAYVHNIDAHNTVDIGISDIHPYMLIVLDNVVFFWRFRMDQMKFLSRPQDHGTYGHNFVGGRCVTAFDASTYSVLGTKIRTLDVTGGLPYDWSTGTGSGTSANPNAYGTADDDRIIYAEGGGNNNQTQFGCIRFYWYPNTRHEALLLWAGCGVKFYGDKLYKPIIENGYVTGYTDNMDEPSDLDDWDGDTKHTVPIEPPKPPTPGPSEDDDITANEFGVGSYTGGVATYYLMTPAELKALILDFYQNADPGMTFSNNIISCFVCIDGIPDIVATSSHKIKIHNSAQDTPFESQATYKEITAIVNPVLGSYEVPRKNNCFLDFSPYTTYEVFVPTVGWLSLPDTVAGRTIDLDYYIDITTCRASAIVKNAGVVMAQGAGTVGSAVPIAVIESGVLAGANIQSAAAVFSSALQAGAGFGSGNIGFGLSGVGNLAQNAAQLVVDGNTNYTMVKGSGGDISQFGTGHLPQIKITHPVSIVQPDKETPDVPNFGHTVGYLCYKTGTLSSFSGFTVCYNPHITGINATSTEKEEIKRLLESGVIL